MRRVHFCTDMSDATTRSGGFWAGRSCALFAGLALALALASGCGNGSSASPDPRIVIAGYGAPLADIYGTFASDNLGKTWTEIPNPPGPFSFVTRDLGFSTDGTRAFRTDDGGRTWTQDSLEWPQAGGLLGIRFFDAMHGIAVGGISLHGDGPPGFVQGFSRFRYTTDGGTTWSDAAIPSTMLPSNLGQLCITSRGLAVAFGARTVSREPLGQLFAVSRDGGRSWQAPLGLIPEGLPLRQIACAGDATIWTTTEASHLLGSRLLRSTDGGDSWFDLTNHLPAEMPLADVPLLGFVDELHGAIGSVDDGMLQEYLVTEDGGETWRPSMLPAPNLRIELIRADLTFARGAAPDGGLFVSRDAGTTWVSVELPPGIVVVQQLEAALALE